MDKEKQESGNIWGRKFSVFGFIVILLFISLMAIRACMLGVPLGEVFRNQDVAPVTADSTTRIQ